MSDIEVKKEKQIELRKEKKIVCVCVCVCVCERERERLTEKERGKRENGKSERVGEIKFLAGFFFLMLCFLRRASF